MSSAIATPAVARPIGRPTAYRPDYHPDLAESFTLLGATLQEVADAIHISVATLKNWLDEHPEFLAAIERGRTAADARVAKSLYHRSIGAQVKTTKPVVLKTPDGGQRVELVEYVEGYPADTNAASLWLRNRRPDLWRDKQDVDVTVNGRISRMPDEERSQKLLELLKRLVPEPPTIDITPVSDDNAK